MPGKRFGDHRRRASTTLGNFEIDLKLAGVTEFERKLKTLPNTLQREVHRKVVRAAGSGFKRIMKKHTPKSRITGTSKKWSESLKAKRQRDSLARSIHVKPSSKWNSPNNYAKRGVIGVTVGHKYRGSGVLGPHAHLVNKGHQLTAWGRRVNIRVRRTGYLEEFWDESVAHARHKMIAKSRQALKVAIDKAARQ